MNQGFGTHSKKHNKKIKISQLPIASKGYKLYVNTTLVGETAPDIIEKDSTAVTSGNPSYVARYFCPLGKFLKEPNPYNIGTELEGIPWRQTFLDGLVSVYDRTLLDYYCVPFSMFTIRIYYNKDLYKEITGKTTPPESFLDLQKVWEKVKLFSQKYNKFVVPIAGSKYQTDVFKWKFLPAFYHSLNRTCDYNFDGEADRFETWKAFQNEEWNFNSPQLIAAWKCMVDIADNFQDGWIAAQRSDATFLFVQKRALMIASGSWDIASLLNAVENNFEIGILDFLVPVNHPVYGEFVKGKVSEAAIGGGMPWSISKQSKNKDICIDFLRFCTTKKNNENLNSAITWLPVISGTKISDILKPFRPDVQGFVGNFNFDLSQEFRLRFEGDKWDLFAGKISPENFANSMQEIYVRTGQEGYNDILDADKRNARNIDRILASYIFQLDETNVKKNNDIESKIIQLMKSSQEAKTKIHYNSLKKCNPSL